jgi:hypothetical protein
MVIGCCIDRLSWHGLSEAGVLRRKGLKSTFQAGGSRQRLFSASLFKFASLGARPPDLYPTVRRSWPRHRRFSPYWGCGTIRNKGAQVKGFPTIEEIERAGKEQLARWYCFLPSGETPADQEIMKRIAERFEKLAGMTAELSKKIGM